ncbi:MAG: cytidyltransferase-like protein, partial [Candidatus Peregrinibacteria bacterium Greene0416_19]
MMSKIQSLETLGKLSRKLKAKGKIVVHCHGTFDLMHPGHIRHFEAAKALGDALVVTVTADRFVKKGIGHPVFREQLRAESIAALTCVDYVCVDPHETSEEVIGIIKPDVYAKGGDYEGKENEQGHPTAREKTLVETHGGRMHFTHDPVTFSSTALLNDHFSSLPESVRAFLDGIRARYSGDDFAALFEKIQKLRVLVIGDAILDVYHYSTFLGRSVKEEIPRVRVLGSEMFLGGSLAVANTLAGFCSAVGVAAVLGRQNPAREKQHERFIRDHLKRNVTPKFFFRDDAPTIINERFVNNEPTIVDKTTKVNMRKYFGLYHINETPISKDLEVTWAKRLKKIASGYDVVIVTDYGLGMLTDTLIKTIARFPTFLAVNTQTNSMNYGFNLITKYPRADYVSISQPEMRLALHDKHSDVEHLAEKIAKAVHAKTVAVTLGALGVLVRDKSGITSIPALSTSVVDNIGAGDAFLALSALGV